MGHGDCTMRVLVCGGRNFSDREYAYRVLDQLHSLHDFTLLINGDAPGADFLSSEWAHSRKITVKTFPADWAKHGRSAGPKRNQQMLDFGVNLVVAFPGGRGTDDMVRRARNAGVTVSEA